MTEKNNRVEIEEIKPCPFCESEAELRQGHTVLDNYVQCKRCGCRTKVFNTKRCAVIAWNKRKTMDRILELLEGLVQYNRDIMLHYQGRRNVTIPIGNQTRGIEIAIEAVKSVLKGEDHE